MEDEEEVTNNITTAELQDQEDEVLEPSEEAIEDSQDVDDQRGQKRALDTSDGQLDTGDKVLLDEALNTSKDLPPGVTVLWKDNVDAIVNFSSTQNRIHSLQLCLVGRARIRCLEGEAEVLGHQLLPDHPEEVTTGSPFWSSWITINVTLSGTEEGNGSTKLQFLSIRGTPSFRLVLPTRPTIIPPSWKSSVDKVCQDFVTAEAPVRFMEDDAFHHSSHQVVMICGAKGVGKSTFLRYLTNRLLQSYPKENNDSPVVAILDADVGQPEFAPPGMLRLCLRQKPLLHPPHWNLSHALDEPTEQIGAVYYGAVTSKVDPTRYIENIQKLFQQYQEMLSQSSTSIPLIVNLDGWIKGMGFEILSSLISTMKPSHVCQILGESKGKTFDLSNIVSTDPEDGNVKAEGTIAAQLFFLDVCNKYVTPVTIPSTTLRTLRLTTYFGPHLIDLWDKLDFVAAKQLQTDWVGDDDCSLAHYLAQEPPYCVPMEAVQCVHTNMTIIDEWEPEQQETYLLQSLNGCIVGLCTDNQKECLGLGIVRSIDWRKRLMYILTPVPQNQLMNVTTLVGGNIPLPLPFLFRGAYAESFPYLASTENNMADASSGGNGKDPSNSGVRNNKILGSEPMKSRNNIGRRGFGGGGKQG